MVLAVVMEIFATLLTRYCHLLGGCGCPDRSETLQTLSQNSPLLPRPPSVPRKGCKLWIKTTAGGTLGAWWDLQSQQCSHESGGHQHIPGVLYGGTPCHLAAPIRGMPEKQEHLHYSTDKLMSKIVHLNTKLLKHSSDCRPYSFHPSSSGQKHNHQEHGFRSAQSCSTESTMAASTEILISTLSILSIWASAAKFKWK